MQIYPFTSPVILNDALFLNYGGKTGTFSGAQRAESYLLAEMLASKYIGTLLLPAAVTGTFGYAGHNRLVTDYGYVHEILSVFVLSKDGTTSCGLDSDSGCAYIFNDTFGYIDFQQALSACRCSSGPKSAYQIQVAYRAGLPTGTASQPGILHALTIVAQADLNERNPGDAGINEGVGDVGIERFADGGSRGYSEVRKGTDLKRTIFGSSPKANYAARLIDASIVKARPVLLL